MTTSMKTIVTMMLALATGCTPSEDDDDGSQNADDSSGVDPAESSGAQSNGAESGAESSSGSGADESSTGPDIDALWDCSEPMILSARELVGPGFDAEMGGLLEPLQDTYVVATTKVWVPVDKQPEFLELSDTVTTELDGTPGMVAYGLAFEPTCGFFRTLSVYRSEEDMYSFVISDPHAIAMSRYSELTITGKTTSWELPAAEFPPTWAMADDRLEPVPPL